MSASRPTRRRFLAAGAATVAALRVARPAAAADETVRRLPATADAVIFIWLPGGVPQADTWDPKAHTPFQAGMKGSDLLGTCPSIRTSVDGLRLGAGLESLAKVMHHGTVLRSLTSATKFGAVHLKAQHAMMTGHLFPAGVKAPGMGAVVSRMLGPRRPDVPPYVYIGRDIDTSDTEKQFINDFLGPGFYGPRYAPLMIPDPAAGAPALALLAGMTPERLDRRLAHLKRVATAADPGLRGDAKAADWLQAVEAARAMMDSPARRAFEFATHEPAETVAAYQPRITRGDLMDKWYWFGQRFGTGLLLARRLVEAGVRFVQVELQYQAFKGFDTHEDGAKRIVELKRQIDAPIAALVADLDRRGMLDRTLVVVATEFGRTIANAPKAGVEPIGFAEAETGDGLTIADETMYGFHGHFSSANSLLFFGGGFKRGFVHGRTADRHPMVPIEQPVCVSDVHATIYKALGLAADSHYVTEGRPFHVTKDGRGRPIDELLA